MLGPSDSDIVNYITTLGLKPAYDNMTFEDKEVLETSLKEVMVQREFRDLRFAELETTSDMATVYKVKDYDKLTTLEFKLFNKFVYHLLFKNRVIKLYPEEYNNIPADIRTLLYEDTTFHDRLKESLIVKNVQEE